MLEALENGFELDEENIKKIIADQMIVRGESMFDKKIFANIKEKIIGSKAMKSNIKSAPPPKLAIDANRELKKFSPIEIECVKDRAINKERVYL